jgi:DNA-binding transcriptional LysR family regulator
MDLRLRQLRLFVAVADAGSVTRAAAELHLAQPALSYQMKRLERDLGVALFTRSGRGIALTDEGRELLDHAQSVLREHDRLLERARSLVQRNAPQLTVGFMAQGPGELLPRTLRAFKRDYPEVEVSLRQFGFDDCFMGVTRGLADVSFSIGPLDEHDDVVAEPLFEEAVVVAVAADHPLAAHTRLHITQILDEPLYTDTHPPGRWRDYWDAIPYRNGSELRVAARFSTHDEWLEGLRMGGGISFCPESTPRYYPRPGLAFLPLDGMAPATHCVLRRRGAPRVVEDFVRTAQTINAGSD